MQRLFRVVSQRRAVLGLQCWTDWQLGAAGHDGGFDVLRRCYAAVPAHTELTMPALSPTMSQGNIASWQVKEGDEVAPGDVLCDVETDKATMAWENQDEGFVARILLPEGAQNVPVGTAALLLVDDANDIAAFKDYQPDSHDGGEAPSSSSKAEEQSADSAAGGDEQEAAPEPVQRSSKLGPAAQLLLKEHGLEPTDITPSGPGGIVTKGDVLKAIAKGVKPGRGAEQQAQRESGKSEQAKSEEHDRTVAKAKESKTSAEVPQAASKKQAAPKQQPALYRRQPTMASRQRSPDSKLKAILAEKMLQQGQRIPDSWLRDWVGARKHAEQAK